MKQPPQNVNLSSSLWLYINATRDLVTQGKLTPEAFDHNLRSIIETIQFYQDQLKQVPPGPLRALQVNRGVDKLIKLNREENAETWKQVTCRTGCNHCCHQMVEITQDDAALLLNIMVKEGIQIDRAKLALQASWSVDPYEWWKKPREERACVFLKDGLCSVYKYRPAACRKLFVVSDPNLCGEPSTVQVLNVNIPEAEMMASAHSDLDRATVGSNMAKVLLKELQKLDMLESEV